MYMLVLNGFELVTPSSKQVEANLPPLKPIWALAELTFKFAFDAFLAWSE